MRLERDNERCEGHGICVATAPSLLDLDDDGLVTPLADSVADHEIDLARLAADACPVQALRVVADHEENR